MMLEITKYCNKIYNSVSYRIGTNVICDPGNEWEGFQDVATVLLTHAHFDHIYGLNRVVELNPHVRIYTNESGREMLLNSKKNLSFYHESPFVISESAHIITVDDGTTLELGEGMTAKAIFTPGHNPSCITWIIEDCLFTGDAYIPDIKTVTNLPGGNKTQSKHSIKIIKELAIGRTIYPGHIVQTPH